LVRINTGYASSDKAIVDTWAIRCESCRISSTSFYDKIFRSPDGEIVVEIDGVSLAAEKWNTRRCSDAEQDH